MSNQHRVEVETEALEGFLAGDPWKRVEGVREIRAWVLELHQSVAHFDQPELDPATMPQRIMVMWRIVRATAQIKGLTGEDETLDETTDTRPSPWTRAFKPINSAASTTALRKGTATRLNRLHNEGEGLPLLPPRDNAEDLDRWCRAAALVSRGLGIERHPRGLTGLQCTLDPDLAAISDITDGHVLAFEELILDEALDLLLDYGDRAAVKHFRDEYGMSRKEAQALLRLAKSQAQQRSEGSTEEKRALQEARLEDYIGRTKGSLDMDGEMKALKELGKVQGLTRSEPENAGKEFFAVIDRVSARQDIELMDEETRLLMAGKSAAHLTEEVEPVTIELKPVASDDPDDVAALEEYDRENQHQP